MKKCIVTVIMTLTLLSLTGCGSKTLKADGLGVEVTLPDKGWTIDTDDSNSFVISKDSDMISYSSSDLPEGYKIPETEDELSALLGDDIMDVSEISDFNYETNEDGSIKSLFYKQTLSIADSSSILINNFKIKNGKLTIANATLTNADYDKISEIENIIKNTDLK